MLRIYLFMCLLNCVSSISFLKILLIFLLRERERKSVRISRGGAKGEGERESQADSELSVEPEAGLSLTTLRS